MAFEPLQQLTAMGRHAMLQQYIKRMELWSTLGVHRIYSVAIVALLLIASAVFATAAADAAAVEHFGVRDGRLVMAAAFATLAIMAHFIARMRHASARHNADAALGAQTSREDTQPERLGSLPLGSALLAGVRDIAPVAARLAARQIPKNAPALIGAAIGLFVAQRLVNYYQQLHDRS